MRLTENVSVTLYEIHQRYTTNKLLLPAHQRKDAWTTDRKHAWWETIKRGGTIPGVIITYHIKGNDQVVYINDGAQRTVHALAGFVSECQSQGLDWERYLLMVKITEQHLEYESTSEAIEHFISINFGTAVTPYEMLHSLFVSSLPNYETIWAPVMDGIHRTVEDAMVRVRVKQRVGNRDEQHKQLRDNWSLYHRFATKNAAASSSNVASKALNAETWIKDAKIENELIAHLKRQGANKSLTDVKRFATAVAGYVALYETAWQRCGLQPHDSPSPAHFRWWLNAALYMSNNGMGGKVGEFTEALIKKTRGKSTLHNPSATGEPDVTTTAMSNLANLNKVVRLAGLSEDFLTPNKRKKKANQYAPGYVRSHLDAVSHHGDGPTVPENRIDNAHRLNRDMTEEERSRLVALP